MLTPTNLVQRLVADTSIAAAGALAATEVTYPALLDELRSLNNNIRTLSMVLNAVRKELVDFEQILVPDGLRPLPKPDVPVIPAPLALVRLSDVLKG